MAVEDGEDGIREILVGVFEEQGELPDLCGGEAPGVGGHAFFGGAEGDLLKEGAGGWVGYSVASGAPELGGGELAGDVLPGGAVAAGTAGGVEVGAGLEDVFAGAEGWGGGWGNGGREGVVGCG